MCEGKDPGLPITDMRRIPRQKRIPTAFSQQTTTLEVPKYSRFSQMNRRRKIPKVARQFHALFKSATVATANPKAFFASASSTDFSLLGGTILVGLCTVSVICIHFVAKTCGGLVAILAIISSVQSILLILQRCRIRDLNEMRLAHRQIRARVNEYQWENDALRNENLTLLQTLDQMERGQGCYVNNNNDNMCCLEKQRDADPSCHHHHQFESSDDESMSICLVSSSVSESEDEEEQSVYVEAQV